jgi:hypothetical protein
LIPYAVGITGVDASVLHVLPLNFFPVVVNLLRPSLPEAVHHVAIIILLVLLPLLLLLLLLRARTIIMTMSIASMMMTPMTFLSKTNTGTCVVDDKWMKW